MNEQAPPPLEPLDEDWSSALAVVAHPDDMEYGAAAAVARWTAQGKRVVYAMVTSGEAGIDGLAPDRCGPLREAEQIASAAAVGVDTVEFLHHPDGVLEYGLPLRRDIARLVRRHRPDVVITTNFRDTYGGVFPNQADHIAAGRATLDAVRDAGNRWVFRELLDAEGLEPWDGVRMLLAAGSPEGRHGVDVTDTFALGVASLAEHKAYLAGLGEHGMADPEEFLDAMLRMAGSRLGVRYASAFEVVPLRMPG
ncbi:PIG-L deacetylase family protein [Streptacidiphilus jiangxiensis]|uniref:N-acetylglucosaminyl deacetylase, LmbE family n=1 Tax=Streptacidiphilus jiangxiensis TaxID=235985 RepID=A0A1H7QMX3_STRJI|nr:PIG-L deacetylase family protein [Streptacidiphilus jiangxiensis]SEL49078.1 N-acetylglucosaminyl deacetylase, LmbE family [Streptacidiphilus jiangxiensis]